MLEYIKMPQLMPQRSYQSIQEHIRSKRPFDVEQGLNLTHPINGTGTETIDVGPVETFHICPPRIGLWRECLYRGFWFSFALFCSGAFIWSIVKYSNTPSNKTDSQHVNSNHCILYCYSQPKYHCIKSCFDDDVNNYTNKVNVTEIM